MALPDAVEDGLRPSPLITWYQSGTATPEVLTGATLTGTITAHSGTVRAITGTLTVTDGPGGVFRWDLSAADVADDGSFRVQFSAAFASGQSPAITFVTNWRVAKHQIVTP